MKSLDKEACKGRFIDIHHHILYGLDDGPETREEMFSMLRVADAEGIGALIATPHVTPGLAPVNEALAQSRLAEANEYCLNNGLNLRIYPGAEVLYNPALANMISQGQVPALAGTRCVLLEFHARVSYREVESAVRVLQGGGYLPILAHVERYRCFRGKTWRLRRLKAACTVLYQMNCAALTGGNGFFQKKNAERLIAEGLIDFAATDAHNGSTRACDMRSFYRAAEKLVGTARAQWLTIHSADRYLLR